MNLADSRPDLAGNGIQRVPDTTGARWPSLAVPPNTVFSDDVDLGIERGNAILWMQYDRGAAITLATSWLGLAFAPTQDDLDTSGFSWAVPKSQDAVAQQIAFGLTYFSCAVLITPAQRWMAAQDIPSILGGTLYYYVEAI